MVLYDEQEVVRSYVESERHDANIETAKRMLKKRKYTLDEIADCAELPLETVEELANELQMSIINL